MFKLEGSTVRRLIKSDKPMTLVRLIKIGLNKTHSKIRIGNYHS
jgi:hypothetical protein